MRWVCVEVGMRYLSALFMHDCLLAATRCTPSSSVSAWRIDTVGSLQASRLATLRWYDAACFLECCRQGKVAMYVWLLEILL